MKIYKVLLICLFAWGGFPAAAQNSPYVELLTGYVNNTGFKSAMLRSAAVSRPVPVHLPTDAVNAKVSPKFILAKVDCVYNLNPLMTWAVASGWTTAANSSSNAGTVASPATGCQGYSEIGYPVGNWRLPTQREMLLIYLVRKEMLSLSGFVDFLLNGTQYWCSTSNSASEAWAMDMATGIMYNRSKTATYRVRCVRDI